MKRNVIAGAMAFATAGLVVLTGCRANTADGPLRPLTAGGLATVTLGAMPVLPGQPALATAFVVNSAPAPVRLVSASVVPVPGYRAGRLVHLAVAATHSFPGAGRHWPPEVPIRPFKGALLQKGQNDIVFAIAARQPGHDYVSAGLRIVYSYAGRRYSTTAWGVDVACVRTVVKSVHQCDGKFDDIVQAKVERMANN